MGKIKDFVFSLIDAGMDRCPLLTKMIVVTVVLAPLAILLAYGLPLLRDKPTQLDRIEKRLDVIEKKMEDE